MRNRRRKGIGKVPAFAFATTETLKGQPVETTLPSHFLNAFAKVGVKNVQVIGSRRSRVDLHIDDFLLEAEKDGHVQRTWCYVDQPLDGMRWFGKDANNMWPHEVIE